MAKKEITADDILKELKNKQYRPVYYLMGEESYYIDKISDYIEMNVLTEEEKEFNQTVVYGNDVEIGTVITAAKRYPMMSSYQVVIVKEAQNLKNIDDLSYYLQKPQPSTILVFCHKNGKIDGRKKVTSMIEKVGILFESKKLKDAMLPSFITDYLRRKGYGIEEKAASMLSEFVGCDLNRMVGELEKLIITLPQGETRITPQNVERNIGISKDYNTFELKNALIDKDVLKANRIINYFEKNPKASPLQPTLALLFSFFSNLMLAYYAPQKSEDGIAAQLSLRNSWQARDYIKAMNKYSGVKVMKIIGEIRRCDARSKGVNNNTQVNGDSELLKELIFYILH